MRLINILLLIFLSVNLFGQSKKLLKKANKAYKYEHYAQAIPMYEEYLDGKENYSASVKLAHCYFKINKLEKARGLYEQVINNDRAKPKTIYNYAQTLVSAEKYEEAKMWFLKYQQLKPDNEQVNQWLQSYSKIKTIQPYFDYAAIKVFPFNSPYDDNAPVYYKDGIIFSSDRKTGVKILSKKSTWTGRDYVSIFYSAMKDSLLQSPKRFAIKLNAINRNNAAASFTEDLSEVYFTRNSSSFSKNNSLNMQLYSGTATTGNRWKNIHRLKFCNNEFNYMHPTISPDGQKLFYISDKPGGEGKMDIYYSKRVKNGWSSPKNLGPVVNTGENEGFPFVYNDSTLFFCSKGHASYGGFDIFITKKDHNGDWSTPINLGKPINSPLDDISFYMTKAGDKGLFSSSRDGGDDDIYMISFSEEDMEEEPMILVSNDEPSEEASLRLVPNDEFPEEESIPLVSNEEPSEEKETTSINIIKIEEPDTMDVTTNVAKQHPAEAPTKVKEENSNTTDVHVINPFSGVDETDNDSSLTIEKPNILEEIIADNSDSSTKNRIVKKEKTIAKQQTATFTQDEAQMMLTRYLDNPQRPESIVIEDLHFGMFRYDLTTESKAALDKISSVLMRFPNKLIEIGGHTCSLGDDKKNLALSQYRANMVLEYLVAKGIERDRLKSVGFGEQYLLNECVNGKACTQKLHFENERIEFKVLP